MIEKHYNNKVRGFAEEVAASFVKSYKCSMEEAVDFFYGGMMGNEEITKIIDDSANAKHLAKNSKVKEFIKKHKKELYYRLRQYKNNSIGNQELMNALHDAREHPTEEARLALLEKVAAYHVSSQERFGENEAFYDKLSEVVGNAASVIDVGCGVQPLFFPVEKFSQVVKYMALDKDQESIRLLKEFKEIFKEQYSWLLPHAWNIGDGWKDAGAETFDLALILKVVAVVKRTDPALLEQLANVPASTLVISGVKESMVKKQDVERRERRAVENFIKFTGRTKVDEFELENEFFIIVS